MIWFKRSGSAPKLRRGFRRRSGKIERCEPRLALSGTSPLAANESYQAPSNVPLSISAPGVLSNDSDPEGDSLAAELFAGPAHGQLSLNADGSFLYTSDPGYTGIDSFLYRASDGASAGGIAAVTLFIGLAPQPPSIDLDGDDSTAPGLDSNVHFTEGGPAASLADADASLTAPNDSSLVSLTATIANLLDGDAERLTADTTGTAIQATYDSAAGRLTLSGQDALGHYLQVLETVAYQNVSRNPHATPRQIVFVADDGAASSAPATAHLSITAVNDPPTAVDHSWNAVQGVASTVDAPGVLANDADPENAPLTAELGEGPQHGALQLNPDGSFTYLPDANYSGIDQFTYRVSDGELASALATVAITVLPSTPAQPLAVNDDYDAAAGQTLIVAAAGVLANDSAAGVSANSAASSGGVLTAVLVAEPLHGTLTFGADGSFSYVPHSGYQGIDGFTYRAEAGGILSDVASVTIHVLAPSESGLPQAVSDIYIISLSGSFAQSADSVLSNDSFGGGAATAIVVTAPEHGALQLNADGTFTYTAGAGFHGIDEFAYRTVNGQGDSTAIVELMTEPAALIRKLYLQILDREPDRPAWEYWTDAITSGGRSLAQVGQTLLESDEYLNLTIRQFYRDFLERNADASGLDFWRDQVWRAGGGPDEVAAGILSSAEMRQHAGGADGDWVDELYRRALDREAETQGFDYWTGLLADHSYDNRQVALGFLFSAEDGRNSSADWYNHYLLRTITPEEQSTAVAQLTAGASNREETCQLQIIGSAEYRSTPAQPPAGVAQRTS